MSKSTRERRRIELSVFRDQDAVYARIPTIACKGLCHDQCTIIRASDAEYVRMAQVGGGEVNYQAVWRSYFGGMGKAVPDCPQLTPQKRCAIYHDRPGICRLYGVVDILPCPHGCEIEGGKPLTNEQGKSVIRELAEISDRTPLTRDRP